VRRHRLPSVALAVLTLAAVPGATAATAAAPEKPTLTKKPPEWTTAQDAEFEFTRAASAEISAFECQLDGAPLFLPCVPDALPPEGRQTYADLAEGVHTFRVRALDLLGSAGDPRVYTWTVDRTAPVLQAPTDVVAEATSATGTPVAYSLPSATDNLDDAPHVACAPAPGSVFPLGETTVTCTPTDRAGNAGTPVSFAVLVRDTTPPSLNPYPDIVVQQNAPAGATVAFDPWPSATDAVDGVLSATCTPSATVEFPKFFALADSPVAVVCSAKDAAGNVSAASTLFRVIVNAGPAPPEPTITAHPANPSRSPSAAFEFASSGAVATSCRLDGPSPSPPEPCVSATTYTELEDGAYVFTIEATDTTTGTVSQATYSWQVDTTPPPAMTGFAGRARPGAVTLTWQKPTDPDHALARLWRQRPGGPWRLVKQLVDATRFTDNGLANDVLFRYRLQSYDDAGNASRPVYTRERPSRIFVPQYGAVLTRPPLIDWTTVRRATYYNVQIWRHGHKILSLWPWRSRLQMRASWRFRGRSYTLAPAGYTVLVWPGFGRKAAARYGSLLGSTSFHVE
jgi:hypothetical protein